MDIDEIIKVFEEWMPELELMAKYNDSALAYQRYSAVEDTIKALKEDRRIHNIIPEDYELMQRIEKALGFRLFTWQKTYITRGTFRQYGKTTAEILRRLIKSEEPLIVPKRFRNPTEKFEFKEALLIYEKLKAAGISTCPVLRER